MKRRGFAALLCLAVMLMALVCLPTIAHATVPLEYTVDDHGIITGVSGTLSGHIEIPAEVDGVQVKGIGPKVFEVCGEITSVNLPDGIISIGDNAFAHCSNLYDIHLPDSLESIGNSAFLYCTSLTQIHLPDNIESIGNSAFYECTSLTEISLPDCITVLETSVFQKCTSLTNIHLPDNLISIGNSAFYECTSLTEISLPSALEEINHAAFCNSGLTSIDIPESATDIGESAFRGCGSLVRVKLPSGLTSISKYLFDGCTALQSLVIPSSVENIGASAIYNCGSLKEIILPAKVTLGDYAITSCDGLETLIFADGTEEIPVACVNYCPNIRNVVVPASVKEINPAFSIEYLEFAKIHYLGTPEQWADVNILTDYYQNIDLDPHFIISDSKPSTCAVQGYENKLICGDGCDYVYSNGTTLPLSEEHAKMDTTTGKCTLCEENIAVAKVDYTDGTTAYIAAQTLNSALYTCYNATAFTMLKDAQVQQLMLYGGTFDLNGCTVTGCLDVRNTVTIQDTAGGGHMYDSVFPVVANGFAIVQSGSFEGEYFDFKVPSSKEFCLDLSQYNDPADLSIYAVKSEKLLYESVRLPAGYVLKDGNNNVLPRDTVIKDHDEVVFVANCSHNEYELQLDGSNRIRGICKHCLHRNGVMVLSAEDCGYDGQSHGAAAQGALAEDWEYTLTIYDSDGNALENDPVNAGTYTAKLTCEAFGQKKSVEVTYTISPADIADYVRAFWEYAEYDGQPHEAQIINTNDTEDSDLVKDVDYTISYTPVDAENALVDGLPVESGEYQITVTGIGNYTGAVEQFYLGKVEGEYPIYEDVAKINPAWLYVEDESVVVSDKVYDGSTDADVTAGELNGVIASEEVLLSVSGTFEDADVGTDKIVYVTYNLYGADASNYAVYGIEEVNASISARNLFVTIGDQSIAYGGEITPNAYDVVGLLNGQNAAVTLTPSTAVITENGTITPTVKITAGSDDVTANYDIHCIPGKLVIVLDTAEVDSSKVETVNNTQQEEIEKVLENVEELLKSDELTEEEKAELTKTKEKAEALLDRIEESLQVLTADEVENTLDTTSENVKLSEKDDIQKAIATMEDALKTYGGNYTDADKKDVQAQIDQLKEALQVVENVESVTALIAELPETVEPDDEAAVAKILEAKAAYDALNAYEKSLVDAVKLNTLLKATTDYQIVKGNGTKWKEGDLSFTANGAFKKFVSVFVDGKEVDTANYKAKAGSTIITFKESYVKTLSAGEHTITVTFTDGAASGSFQVLVNPAVPDTGDEGNLLLWCSWMFLAAGAIWVFGRRFAAK